MDARDLDQLERDLLGDIDASFLVNAAAELANKGIVEKQKADAAQRSSADDDAKAAAAIAADAHATEACAALQTAQAAPKPDPTVIASYSAIAQSASDAQAQAGIGLSPNAQAKRVAAANAAVKSAMDRLAKSPKSVDLQALARCAQATAAKAAAGGGFAFPGGTQQPVAPRGDGFFKRMWGPLPVWGWGLVGVGAVGLIGGAVALFRRK